MAKHMQVLETGIYPDKALTIAADKVAIWDSVANLTKVVPVSGLAGLVAANTAVATIPNLTATDVQAALAELQGDVDGLISMTGTYVGAATTVAGFATTDQEGNAIGLGDIAILSAQDGSNDAGLYAYDGSAWQLAASIPNIVGMAGATATVAGTSGLVPAPAAGDENKLLNGAGAWVDSVAESLQATVDIGNTSTKDVEFTAATAGIVLLSANGTKYRVTVDNDSSLITSVVV